MLKRKKGQSKKVTTSAKFKDKRFNIATWNLQSLYQTGAIINVTEDLVKYKIDIAAVQETRLLQNNISSYQKYTLYNSGNTKTEKHEFGTGFFVSDKIKPYIISFKSVGKYMCVIRIRTLFRNLSILNVHAPTGVKDSRIKDDFYEMVHVEFENLPSSDIKIVLGDFNAQVGKEIVFRKIVGNQSLHETCNDNGLRLVSFAAENNLIVKDTFYERKDIHKVTLKPSVRWEGSQIDHILMEAKNIKCIEHIRSYRGTRHRSDHFLVKCKLRMRISNTKKSKAPTRSRYDTDKLKDREVQQRYQTELSVRLLNINDNLSVNDMEDAIRKAITVTNEDILGKQIRRPKNGWYDEECRLACDSKRDAAINMHTIKTRAAKCQYKQVAKTTYRLLRAKKRKYLDDKISSIQQDALSRGSRSFYKRVKKEKQGYIPRVTQMKNSDGTLISDECAIFEKWRTYFSNRHWSYGSY